MNNELDKQYNPADYEDAINKEWEDSGFYNPDNLKLPADAPAYTIVLPAAECDGQIACRARLYCGD